MAAAIWRKRMTSLLQLCAPGDFETGYRLAVVHAENYADSNAISPCSLVAQATGNCNTGGDVSPFSKPCQRLGYTFII